MFDEDRPTLAECQADEYYLGPTNVPTGGIRCAHCRNRHETVADIKWCRDLGDEIRAEAEAEQAAEAASELAFARSLEARAERGGPEPEDRWGEDDDPITYATAIGYAGACEDGHCDVYNRCSKHRQQDVDRGDRNGHYRSYSD